MTQRCETCRFSALIAPPEPLKPTIQRSKWWGLIKYEDGPSSIARDVYNYQKQRAEQEVFCQRYPEPELFEKTHWCGEYQEKPHDA